MKHRLDLASKALEPREQAFDRHDVAEIALGDIAPFVASAEVVDDHNIGTAGFVEGRPEDRADKPAAAGNHQHQAASSLERALATRAASASSGECAARMASMRRVVERPSTRSIRTTRPP